MQGLEAKIVVYVPEIHSIGVIKKESEPSSVDRQMDERRTEQNEERHRDEGRTEQNVERHGDGKYLDNNEVGVKTAMSDDPAGNSVADSRHRVGESEETKCKMASITGADQKFGQCSRALSDAAVDFDADLKVGDGGGRAVTMAVDPDADQNLGGGGRAVTMAADPDADQKLDGSGLAITMSVDTDADQELGGVEGAVTMAVDTDADKLQRLGENNREYLWGAASRSLSHLVVFHI